MTEASGEAFESGFNGYQELVGKLFADLDLSDVTQEAVLILVSGVEARVTAKVSPPTKASQATLEVPAPLICPKVEAPESTVAPSSTSIEASAPASSNVLISLEIISLEDDLVATLNETSQAKA
ncbi:hypothetical protein COCNU_02G004280 [Cocos nucifera]|uniref:Uncharacterized protein n=1 Tax=Cocos nucifera TaxID=13894 RepID=A0A8K0HYF0_COCNU|nr:hypothetical protein COCNU_02G004280 [Cocos nucifera]